MLQKVRLIEKNRMVALAKLDNMRREILIELQTVRKLQRYDVHRSRDLNNTSIMSFPAC